jgi:chromatin remodeling complex protein RSC6
MAKSAKKKTASKSAKSKKKPAARKTAKKKSSRKPNAAFMAPVTPSAALSEVVGSKPLPRTELTKKLWQYIKKNNLQDPKNKRMIRADDNLFLFTRRAPTSLFELRRGYGEAGSYGVTGGFRL